MMRLPSVCVACGLVFLLLASKSNVMTAGAEQTADSQVPYKVVHSFSGQYPAPSQPQGGVIRASDGFFYGTTNIGGIRNLGAIYRMTAAGVVTLLHEFGGAPDDGAWPFGDLVEGVDGKLYGTTWKGGEQSSVFDTGRGTVFTVSLVTGQYRMLPSFDPLRGCDPVNLPLAGLTKGIDGHLYGMGSGPGCGSPFFKVTPAGSVMSIPLSSQPGTNAQGRLMLGSDGNFYGTWSQNSFSAGAGIVFRVTPTGTVTALHTFSVNVQDLQNLWPDGGVPLGGLAEGPDGSIYGTTQRGGGVERYGVIFRISPQGEFSVLHRFDGADGREPWGNLVRGSDGKFYGTTFGGGQYSNGTIFRFDAHGTFTLLRSITHFDGWGPRHMTLLEESPGVFLGTAMGGGMVQQNGAQLEGGGVVFRIGVTPSDTTPPELTLPANITQEATSGSGALVTYTASARDVVDGPVAVNCNPASGTTFALGMTTVNCSASDKGNNARTGSFLVTVRDTTAPALTVPSNQVVEATSPSGAVVSYPAPTSADAVGVTSLLCTPSSGSTFAIAITTVTCRANDAAGNTATKTFTVTVRDSFPPEIRTVTANPGSLWPPNHQMVKVAIAVSASDAVTARPSCAITSVISSEPDNGLGDGDTAGDIGAIGAGGLDVSLRAERGGNGPGRVYTIEITCSDAASNKTRSITAVAVPKSQGK